MKLEISRVIVGVGLVSLVGCGDCNPVSRLTHEVGQRAAEVAQLRAREKAAAAAAASHSGGDNAAGSGSTADGQGAGGPDQLGAMGVATADTLPLFTLDLEPFGSGVETFAGTFSKGERFNETRERDKAGDLHVTTTGQENTPSQYFGHGDALYSIDGSGSCQMMRGEMAHGIMTGLAFGSGAALVGAAFGLAFDGVPRAQAQLVTRGESVAGRQADHYHFHVNRNAFVIHHTLDGDVWIDQATKRAVKSNGHVTFTAPSDHGPQTQQGSWTFALSRLGEDVTVPLPAACASVQQHAAEVQALPRLPGAHETMSTGEVSMDEAPGTVATATAFYRTQMTARGWTVKQSIALGNGQMFGFQKGDAHITVTIAPSDGGKVMVTLARGQ